jgi:hypothetical protein
MLVLLVPVLPSTALHRILLLPLLLLPNWTDTTPPRNVHMLLRNLEGYNLLYFGVMHTSLRHTFSETELCSNRW